MKPLTQTVKFMAPGLGVHVLGWGQYANTSDAPADSKHARFIEYSSSALPTFIQEECESTTRHLWFYQPYA